MSSDGPQVDGEGGSSRRAAFGALWLLTLLGAALLFTVEPMSAKLLIPSCGGAFHVWATCLTFFQGVLFLGYLYCLLLPRLGRWHLLVIATPLLALRVTPLGDLSAAPTPESPTPAILWALLLDIGLPFFVLSTTSVATQTWLARSELPQRHDPYRLYSASNLGSLIGLLAYPLLWERVSGLHAQRLGWSVGFGVYALLALAIFARPLSRLEPAPASEAAATTWGARATWFLLSAIPAAFLVSATGVLVEDLGNLPLVWVVPLVVYLGSFVVLFGRRSWVPGWALRISPAISAFGLWSFFGNEALTWSATLGHVLALGAVCLLMHGALHARRPPTARLAEYWLVNSLGGWAGGASATFLAPMIFDGLWDYPLCVVACWVVLLGLGWRNALGSLGREPLVQVTIVIAAWAVVGTGIAHALVEKVAAPPVLYRFRNVYGVYRVTASAFHNTGPVRTLHHGSTVHGRQRIKQPAIPISYYNPQGPFGEVFACLGAEARCGIVGLGIGGLAGYCKPDWSMTFYELDPDCETIAREWFTFLEDSSVEVRVVHGDARLTLAQDPQAGRYDLLAMDAFIGDAIPTHLLTREAFALYREHLAPDGLLLVHVSNRYYDLVPVVTDTRPPELYGACSLGAAPLLESPLQDASHVIVLSPSKERLEPLLALGWEPLPQPGARHVWTDDHADLLDALRW